MTVIYGNEVEPVVGSVLYLDDRNIAERLLEPNTFSGGWMFKQ